MIGVFDIFSVGIGPSSSHTVGPMLAANHLIEELVAIDEGRRQSGVHIPVSTTCTISEQAEGRKSESSDGPFGLSQIDNLRIEFFGSLGATGQGHGSDRAVLSGLMGAHPATVNPENLEPGLAELRSSNQLTLLGGRPLRQHTLIGFDVDEAITFRPNKRLPHHPNALRFHLHGPSGWQQVTYYSIGGGFIARDNGSDQPVTEIPLRRSNVVLPYPFRTGAELLTGCLNSQLSVAQLMMANETARGLTAEAVIDGLGAIWAAMNQSIDAGCHLHGLLPGGLGVRHRAPMMLGQLMARAADADSLAGLDWVSLWALAVGEVNASGGRIVTAPTNGAAGIMPAVLRYAGTLRTIQQRYSDEKLAAADFLLAAGAIGAIYLSKASISGAEVGCQGEIGVACSMAAAGLAHVLGGTAQQVLNAAEIGLEHHLGLTCDPVGGLVQVPCIERNAIGASTAITAARLALSGDGNQIVSLDQVIATMMEVGRDMKSKYKETSDGGLAVALATC